MRPIEDLTDVTLAIEDTDEDEEDDEDDEDGRFPPCGHHEKTKYPILETKMNEPILKSKFTCVQISNTEIHGPARFLTEP